MHIGIRDNTEILELKYSQYWTRRRRTQKWSEAETWGRSVWWTLHCVSCRYI